MHEIALPSYRVTVAPDALAAVADRVTSVVRAHRYALITDSTVGALYADPVVASFAGATVDVLEVPAGETHKSRAEWSRLTDALLALGHARDSCIIALGGGVVGDLAGFVAATYMRGIPYVQVPTTLLAMVDASIGGKTGVDSPAGKNLIGAFHQPAAVIVDPGALRTLPHAHLRAGLAEVIKHGIVASVTYFDRVERDLPMLLAPDGARSDAMEAIIARSIRIKADIVRRDVREAGVRKVLNFGHTLGHAIETLSGYSLPHGEAVAIGMVLEARLAERVGAADAALAGRVRAVIERAGLPTERPVGMDSRRIIELTRLDKKARDGMAEYALPSRIGQMADADSGWTRRIPDEIVLDVLS